MSITIRGTAAIAWHTVAPGDGRARLHVELATGEGHATVRAVLLVGQGPAAQLAAGNAAHHLRKGQRVTVYGTGLAIDPKGRHLVVCGCTNILHDEAITA